MWQWVSISRTSRIWRRRMQRNGAIEQWKKEHRLQMREKNTDIRQWEEFLQFSDDGKRNWFDADRTTNILCDAVLISTPRIDCREMRRIKKKKLYIYMFWLLTFCDLRGSVHTIFLFWFMFCSRETTFRAVRFFLPDFFFRLLYLLSIFILIDLPCIHWRRVSNLFHCFPVIESKKKRRIFLIVYCISRWGNSFVIPFIEISKSEENILGSTIVSVLRISMMDQSFDVRVESRRPKKENKPATKSSREGEKNPFRCLSRCILHGTSCRLWWSLPFSRYSAHIRFFFLSRMERFISSYSLFKRGSKKWIHLSTKPWIFRFFRYRTLW